MAATVTHLENTHLEETPFVKTERVFLRRQMSISRQWIIDALLWCALCASLILGAANISVLRRYPQISLRYDRQISGQTAYNARQYAIRQGGEDTFWLTFWHETKAVFSGEYNTANAGCILYSGDAQLVWVGIYLYGTAPGVTDSAGCAVSTALAWELWGGIDVVGKTVEVGDQTRTVRGVFEGEEALALLSVRDEDTEQSFTAVELSAGPISPAKADVERFAMAAGLGRPDYTLMGTLNSLAEIISALPLMILVIYALAIIVGRLKKHPAAYRMILFAALMGFAFLLPGLLDMLPGWMIPTRWSDFSFWGSLSKQIGKDLREFFMLPPKLRDVELKILLLKQAGIAFLSASLALSICFRQSSNERRIEQERR